MNEKVNHDLDNELEMIEMEVILTFIHKSYSIQRKKSKQTILKAWTDYSKVQMERQKTLIAANRTLNYKSVGGMILSDIKIYHYILVLRQLDNDERIEKW